MIGKKETDYTINQVYLHVSVPNFHTIGIAHWEWRIIYVTMTPRCISMWCDAVISISPSQTLPITNIQVTLAQYIRTAFVCISLIHLDCTFNFQRVSFQIYCFCPGSVSLFSVLLVVMLLRLWVFLEEAVGHQPLGPLGLGPQSGPWKDQGGRRIWSRSWRKN